MASGYQSINLKDLEDKNSCLQHIYLEIESRIELYPLLVFEFCGSNKLQCCSIENEESLLHVVKCGYFEVKK